MSKINKSMPNSRVSIAGRSIVIDYEFSMHCYLNKAQLCKDGLVPVEMYPWRDDILVGYVPVDDRFGTADLEALYQWALRSIAEESEIEEEDQEEMSREEAIAAAAKYGLIREVVYCMDHRDMTPAEALAEWDILLSFEVAFCGRTLLLTTLQTMIQQSVNHTGFSKRSSKVAVYTLRQSVLMRLPK